MSKPIYKKVLSEIRSILTTDSWIQIILNAIIVFLISFIVFYSINLYPFYIASGLSLLYFLFNIFSLRADIVKLEKKHPELSDEIQTFNDTLKEENYIIEKLREDVLQKLGKVANSEFIDYKKLYIKTFFTILLCFAVISFAAFNIQFDLLGYAKTVDVKSMISIEKDAPEDLNLVGSAIDAPRGTGEVAKLKGRSDEFAINYETELDFSVLSDPEKKEQNIDEDIVNIRPSADDIFIENINKEEEEVIKKYLQSIS